MDEDRVANDNDRPLLCFSAKLDHTSWALPSEDYGPYPAITGSSIVAEFSEPIDELRASHGRLAAKAGGMWHVIPFARKV